MKKSETELLKVETADLNLLFCLLAVARVALCLMFAWFNYFSISVMAQQSVAGRITTDLLARTTLAQLSKEHNTININKIADAQLF